MKDVIACFWLVVRVCGLVINDGICLFYVCCVWNVLDYRTTIWNVGFFGEKEAE